MSNEIGRPVNEQLPAFLQDEKSFGDELMDKYIRPPRLKIIQSMAREPYDQFEAGEVVITPALTKVAGFDKSTKKGDIWHFVPLFFYPEWCKWNPLELVGEESAIAERTFDSKHEIAVKAQSPDTWEEPHPKGGNYRYCEHLNFILAPLEPEQFIGMQFAMTFARAEFRSGSNLCALIRMRNAPLCAQVFQAQVGHRKNNRGQWYGLDCSVPTKVDGFIQDQQTYELFKAMHGKLAEAHADHAIEIDYNDGVETSNDSSEF